MDLVTKALAVAQEAHRGQVDKLGKPYIFHPIRVSDSLSDYSEEIQAVGLLHDVIEDTELTLEDLHLMDFPVGVIHLVEILTKKEGVTYKEYISNITFVQEAIIVKIADIKDNYPKPLRPLPEEDKGLEERYKWAIFELGKALYGEDVLNRLKKNMEKNEP